MRPLGRDLEGEDVLRCRSPGPRCAAPGSCAPAAPTPMSSTSASAVCADDQSVARPAPPAGEPRLPSRRRVRSGADGAHRGDQPAGERRPRAPPAKVKSTVRHVEPHLVDPRDVRAARRAGTPGSSRPRRARPRTRRERGDHERLGHLRLDELAARRRRWRAARPARAAAPRRARGRGWRRWRTRSAARCRRRRAAPRAGGRRGPASARRAGARSARCWSISRA